MKIIVDLMGGDNAPHEIVAGCIEALNGRDGFELALVGNVEVVEPIMTKYKFDPKRIELIHSTEVITNNDVPTDAIKSKKNSSIVLGYDRLNSDDECVAFVSAGSTGAILTGSVLKLGRIEGVSRPALAPLLPTLDGKNVLLLDCGANVDCKPTMLLHFALMGSAYVSSVLGSKRPRVALLNNGTEDTKGNQLAKEAFVLLKNCKAINFLGNMEARDLLSGSYDVVVADGFSGNIALKTCEGTALAIMKQIKDVANKGIRGKIGGLLLKKSLKDIKKTMDYNERGGALFCGLKKIVLKVHGSVKSSSIKGAIYQACVMHERNLIDSIKSNIALLETEAKENGVQPSVIEN